MDSKIDELFTLKRGRVTCCVEMCPVPDDPELSFHSFPKESELRNEWAQALSLNVIEDDMKVCGGHFHEEDFFSTSGAFKVRKLNVKRLKRTAVPSLHLPGSNPDVSLPDGSNYPIEIVKSEISSYDTIKLKNEAEFEQQEIDYEIGTYCCTNCGFIVKNESLFLEHLYSHVKNEECDDLEDESEDPTALGVKQEMVYVSDANKSEEPPAFTESLDRQKALKQCESHVCKFCFRKFITRRNSSIFRHLWKWHKTEPELERIALTKDMYLREAMVQRIVIMGDYFAAKKDNSLTISKFIENPAQDKLVQDCIFGDMSSPLTSRSFQCSSVFQKPSPTLFTRSFRRALYPSKPVRFTRKRLVDGDGVFESPKRIKNCNYCRFQTVDVALATAHFQLHANEKPIGCFGCQKYFDSERDLLVQHTTTSFCANILVMNFSLQCPQCAQIFACKASHVYHILYDHCGER